MCGIWGYIGHFHKPNILNNAFQSIRHRGPFNQRLVTNITSENIFTAVGFHQLNVMSKKQITEQPFMQQNDNYTNLIACNGEIYNYKLLNAYLQLDETFDTDCSILPHINHKFELLEGEFAIASVIESDENVSLQLQTDHLSIRPIFFGFDNNCIMFSSELKGLTPILNGRNIMRIPPSTKLNIKTSTRSPNIETYKPTFKYYYKDSLEILGSYKQVCNHIHNILQSIVENMIYHTQHDVGFLLSGGLDSSIVCALANLIYKQKDSSYCIKTFSIGIEGSTDEPYAKLMAQYLGSDHTHVTVSVNDCINVIPEVIKSIETFDVTTIRASVPQYLLAKYIREHTDITVVLGGDGSDELFSGYMYNHYAPNLDALHNDSIKRLKDIHKYDALRADRTMMAHSIEMRFPFLDRRLIELIQAIDPIYRQPRYSEYHQIERKIEKCLLRDSFQHILPKEVCYRTKEAFSDGISSVQNSWHHIIQKHYAPKTEKQHYKEIFDSLYPNCEHLIGDYWMPTWTNGNRHVSDPSARELYCD